MNTSRFSLVDREPIPGHVSGVVEELHRYIRLSILVVGSGASGDAGQPYSKYRPRSARLEMPATGTSSAMHTGQWSSRYTSTLFRDLR